MDLACVDREFYGSPDNDDIVNSTSEESNFEEGFYPKSLLSSCQKDKDVLGSWYESNGGSNSQDIYRNWHTFSTCSPVTDLSDVLTDSHKLCKETQYLMHLLDENDTSLNIPPPKSFPGGMEQIDACSKSFSNLELNRLNSNAEQVINIELQTDNLTNKEFNQAINYQSPVKIPCFNTNEMNPLENYPINVQMQSPNYTSMPREHMYAPCQYVKLQSQSPVFYSPTSLQSQNHVNSGCLTSPSHQNISGYKEKTTVREERQKKRREKNRECSRLFRVKQKVKEGNLKRGQCDKEAHLDSLLKEKDRLERALNELSRNGSICTKASTMLSECRHLFNNDKMKW